MEKVIVHIIDISFIKDNESFIMSYVDSKRREKALKFVHENDRLLSLGAGYLLKKYLHEGDINISPSGKPYLSDGPFFNLAHSGEYVILVVHPTREVGVDIEKIDESKKAAVEYVLNEEEKKVKDLNDLFQIWTNKESLIKCTSVGIKDIKKAPGYPLTGIKIFNEEEFYNKSLIYNGYSISVTLKEKQSFEIELNKN